MLLFLLLFKLFAYLACYVQVYPIRLYSPTIHNAQESYLEMFSKSTYLNILLLSLFHMWKKIQQKIIFYSDFFKSHYLLRSMAKRWATTFQHSDIGFNSKGVEFTLCMNFHVNIRFFHYIIPCYTNIKRYIN